MHMTTGKSNSDTRRTVIAKSELLATPSRHLLYTRSQVTTSCDDRTWPRRRNKVIAAACAGLVDLGGAGDHLTEPITALDRELQTHVARNTPWWDMSSRAEGGYQLHARRYGAGGLLWVQKRSGTARQRKLVRIRARGRVPLATALLSELSTPLTVDLDRLVWAPPPDGRAQALQSRYPGLQPNSLEEGEAPTNHEGRTAIITLFKTVVND